MCFTCTIHTNRKLNFTKMSVTTLLHLHNDMCYLHHAWLIHLLIPCERTLYPILKPETYKKDTLHQYEFAIYSLHNCKLCLLLGDNRFRHITSMSHTMLPHFIERTKLNHKTGVNNFVETLILSKFTTLDVQNNTCTFNKNIPRSLNTVVKFQ